MSPVVPISTEDHAGSVSHLLQHVCSHCRCAGKVDNFAMPGSAPRQPDIGRATTKRCRHGVFGLALRKQACFSFSGCGPASAAPCATPSHTTLCLMVRSPMHRLTEACSPRIKVRFGDRHLEATPQCKLEPWGLQLAPVLRWGRLSTMRMPQAGCMQRHGPERKHPRAHR